MSIDRDKFESATEADLADVSAPDRVLGFLVANADRAFEAHEIASRTDLDDSVVSTALSRLKDRDLVEHKATYWAATNDEDRLAGYDGYQRASALFNRRLGEEDAEAWLGEAPNEPHPSAGDDE